ncbi:Thymidylate kinase [uncultured Candidatus Thioglobus sp.]|nr:Thymidylate kinase [uncultured Candidatus Thioglobus sp.]
MGGIYDLLADEFHRYATDNAWLFPHFEKMLYNQAQLTMVYIKAFELTKNPLYKRVFTQTLDYTIREIQAKNDGFYSATDADSEGEEGLFFIWTIDEIKTVLTDDFKIFEQYFDLSNSTEFESAHVLHYKNFTALKQTDFDTIKPLLQKLYNARQKREKPLLDNKILLSWNALLLKAFTQASEYDKKYLIKAKELNQFLLNNFYQTDLKRVYINNKTSQTAIFEDYAYFADALIKLFDKTNDVNHLQTAQKLINTAIEKNLDNENHGFKISNNNRIQNNLKEIYDGAIFSSNGIAYAVLNKLSNRLKTPQYKTLALQLINAFSEKISQNPSAYSSIVTAYSAFQKGSINGTMYAYNGKIKITSGKGKINLVIKKGWHINTHKVLQQALIATKITNKQLKTVHYPNAKIIQLSFSKDKLAVL